MAKHDYRENGRYARSRYNPYYDPDDQVRCRALQRASDNLSQMVGHELLDRDLVRHQIALGNGNHPDLRDGKHPNPRQGFGNDVPQVVDDLLNAGLYAHLQSGWQNRGR